MDVIPCRRCGSAAGLDCVPLATPDQELMIGRYHQCRLRDRRLINLIASLQTANNDAVEGVLELITHLSMHTKCIGIHHPNHPNNDRHLDIKQTRIDMGNFDTCTKSWLWSALAAALKEIEVLRDARTP